MADLHAVPETPELMALHARLAEYSLGGHWQTREQNRDLVPHLWPWSVIYSCLMESGEVLLRSGRNFPAAVQFLRRYLALNSKVEEAPAFKAHYLLGTALEKQGDKQAAAQEYRAALSLAKGFSRAQEALDRLNR